MGLKAKESHLRIRNRKKIVGMNTPLIKGRFILSESDAEASHTVLFLTFFSVSFFTAHTRNVRKGNVFSLSFHRGGREVPGHGTGLILPPPRPGTRVPPTSSPELEVVPEVAPEVNPEVGVWAVCLLQ